MKFEDRYRLIMSSIINEGVGGIEPFIGRMIETFPMFDAVKDDIAGFIERSGCRRIAVEGMPHIAFSLSDRMILSDRVFNYGPAKFLYTLFHETIHQYQYKKYGEKKMYEFYLGAGGDKDIMELAEFMRKVELVADRGAIRELEKYVRKGVISSYEVNAAVGRGNYRHMPLSHFIDFINKVREEAARLNITDSSQISEMLYNYLKGAK
jgi:hypothetical protein